MGLLSDGGNGNLLRRLLKTFCFMTVIGLLTAATVLAEYPDPPVVTDNFKMNNMTYGNQEKPVLLGAGSGFYAIWQGYVYADNSGYGLFIRKFDNSGTAGLTETCFTEVLNFSNWNASADIASGGKIVVVYQIQNDDTDNDITFRIITETDGIFTVIDSNLIANESDEATLYQANPEVIWLDDGNTFMVVWEEIDPNLSGYDIYGSVWELNNSTFEATVEKFIINSNIVGNQRHAILCKLASVNDNTTVLVVWDGGYDYGSGAISAQKIIYNTSGTVSFLDDEYNINTTVANNQQNPYLAKNGNNIVVVWESYNQSGAGYNIAGQRLNTDGDNVGDEFMVYADADNHNYEPRVVIDDSGYFIVAWHQYPMENGEGDYDVYARRFSKLGYPVGDAFLVNPENSSAQKDPDILLLGDNFVVAYQGYGLTDPNNGIYGKIYEKDIQVAKTSMNTKTYICLDSDILDSDDNPQYLNVVEIPVSIDNPSENDPIGVIFGYIEFDPALFGITIIQNSYFTDSWILQEQIISNNDEDENEKDSLLIMLTSNGVSNQISSDTNGTLFNIQLTAQANASNADGSEIRLVGFSFNEGRPSWEHEGVPNVKVFGECGDVDLDGEVTLNDALKVLMYLIDSDTYDLSDIQLALADACTDAGITILDAYYIWAYFNGLVESLPQSSSGNGLLKRSMVYDQQLPLDLREFTGRPGFYSKQTLYMVGEFSLKALDIQIEYDNTLLNFNSLSLSDISSSCLVVSDVSDSLIKVLLVGDISSSEYVPILDFNYAISSEAQMGDSCNVILKNVKIDNQAYEGEDTAWFRVVVGIKDPSSEIPDMFSVGQNYPNPFNSSTIIPYQIPVRGDVELIITDMLGHSVRRWYLVDQQPGEYRLTWDGTNRMGNQVSAGIYFYNIRSGDFSETRKMVFLK